jgi:hypothetical protein
VSETLKLEYRFNPVPDWVFEYKRSRAISPDEACLVESLFHLANKDRLKGPLSRPSETPTLTLDRLLEYVTPKKFRRTIEYQRAREALRKRLLRGQEHGLFRYRLIGNPAVGHKYVFTLMRAAPTLSGTCPSTDGAKRPGAGEAKARPVTDAARKSCQSVSGSERARTLHERPVADAPRPPAQTPPKLHEQPEAATACDEPGPAALDVLENTYTSPRTKALGEASALDVSRATESDDTTDRLQARIYAARDAQKRQRRRLSWAWIDTLPGEPREVDGVSERDLVAALVVTLDADLVPDDAETDG